MFMGAVMNVFMLCTRCCVQSYMLHTFCFLLRRLYPDEEVEDEEQRPEHSTSEGKPGHVTARPGFTCTSNGERLPLGPRVEFKIIDYGSSLFSPTLAQATGGFCAREAYRQMSALFEGQQVAFHSDSNKKLFNVSTAAGNTTTGGTSMPWMRMPARLRQRVSFQMHLLHG